MASGKFASMNIGFESAGQWHCIYTVEKTCTLNVRFCNKNEATAYVSLAISEKDDIASGDYLDFLTPIEGNQFLEDTGIVCSPGEKIFVSASGNVSVRVHGLED